MIEKCPCVNCPEEYYCDDLCPQALMYHDEGEPPKDFHKAWEDSRIRIVNIEFKDKDNNVVMKIK